jgi:phosphatidylserine synthase
VGFIGITRVLAISLILLVLFRQVLKKHKPTDNIVYILAFFMAGVYVLLQEFKIHNLGGNNVFNSTDVFFSILGLVVSIFLLYYIKPSLPIKN